MFFDAFGRFNEKKKFKKRKRSFVCREKRKNKKKKKEKRKAFLGFWVKGGRTPKGRKMKSKRF